MAAAVKILEIIVHTYVGIRILAEGRGLEHLLDTISRNGEFNEIIIIIIKFFTASTFLALIMLNESIRQSMIYGIRGKKLHSHYANFVFMEIFFIQIKVEGPSVWTCH